MDDYPFFTLPRQAEGLREARRSAPVQQPTKRNFSSQSERVTRYLHGLVDSFNSGAASLTTDVAGSAPENVLVIQIDGRVDEFYRAVSQVEGLEWIGESQGEIIGPDSDVHFEGAEDRGIPETIYMTMASSHGLDQIFRVYEEYVDNKAQSMTRGLTPWRDVFDRIREMRWWGPEDRLSSTDILASISDVLDAEIPVRVEAELWFSDDEDHRSVQYETFRTSVIESGGTILDHAVIEAIQYHGVLFELPRTVALELLDGDRKLPFLNSEPVQYLSAAGQSSTEIEPIDELDVEIDVEPPLELGDPRVGILDGFPMQNHRLLTGRLRIDDPQDWATSLSIEDRQHGTQMASAVIWGDRSRNQSPLESSVYIRPILNVEHDRNYESIPSNKLQAEFLRQVLMRMFQGDETVGPVASSVRVINFSIGNLDMPFHKKISPLARLFDWAAWKYNVMFVVSAGNAKQILKLGTSVDQWESMDDRERKNSILRSMVKSNHHRKIISPADGMNVMTVGSLAHDESDFTSQSDHVFEPFGNSELPSPVSRIGSGFRGMIKPDLVHNGGRIAFRLRNLVGSQEAEIRLVGGLDKPGVKVAIPSGNENSREGYAAGTSHAAALVTRAAAKVIHVLEEHPNHDKIEGFHEAIPILTRTILAHSTAYPDDTVQFRSTLSETSASQTIYDYFGFGVLDEIKLLSTAENRAVMLSWGIFQSEGCHYYDIPIPEEFSGAQWKRVALTLAWFTDIAPQRLDYRQAKLNITTTNKFLNSQLGAGNSEKSFGSSSQRGTLLQTVVYGQGDRAFTGESTLRVGINCNKGHGLSTVQDVRYGFVVSFEARDNSSIAVRSSIRTRLRQQVQTEVRVRV